MNGILLSIMNFILLMRRIFDLRALAVLFGKRPKAGGTEIGTNDGFRDWNSFEAGLSLASGLW